MAKRNIHNVDRLLRVLLAMGLALCGYFTAGPRFEMLFYGLAVILVLNALVGISATYILFNINTRESFERRLWLEGILIYSIVFVALIPLYLRGEFAEFDHQLFLATGIGFVAQLIDGSLGMAYGITSNTFLLSFGIPPVVSSASIHTAEIFTAGAEGVAHLRAGNVDKGILKYLIIPGVLGAIAGAYLLTSIPGDLILPFISVYLFIMGFLLIEKAFERKPLIIKTFIFFRDKLMRARSERWGRKLTPFGFVGGILDSIGGGGWGPLITLTLFFKGENLRKAIGSVILSEFFVAVAASAALLAAIHLEYWQTIVGLIIGGLLAVPLGPYLTKKLPYKPLMILVGLLVTLLSLKNLISFFLSQV
ncbi:TSUP family transporter [Patescibacteria group bacterium]|nr:TSUP family transporter [Patescibacteria group bacterium]MBU1016394.1 TSUP family transporter [Patescibacteria group bacterium]MBU1685142.1 TSUP family transporter [Patescibacteria group bacterium]MBU1938799.1 TSUP family transporter [Patescibacteria group bacterium]